MKKLLRKGLNDNWTSFDPLRSIIQGLLSREAANLKIKDVVDSTGRWDWSSFQMIFRMRSLEILWPLQFLFLPDLKTSWPESTRPREILIL